MDSDDRLSIEQKLEEIQQLKAEVSDGNRPEAVEQRRESGALTTRERIDHLCDDNSFEEVGKLVSPMPSTPETYDWTREDAPADGLVAGVGEIDGTPVSIAANDFTVKGGSVGNTGNKKIQRVLDIAVRNGHPVILLMEGTGGRIEEGLDSRAFAQGDNVGIFDRLTKLSGWAPIVCAILGPGFGAPTNFSALADYVVMHSERGSMGIVGPPLIRAGLGTDVEYEDFDAEFHTRETGMADRAFETEEACLDSITTFLSHFPKNADGQPPVDEGYEQPYTDDVEALIDVVPSNPKKGYDIHGVLDGIVDRNSLYELKPNFARNIVTGFARIEGQPIGIVANNPRFLAGSLDVNATHKTARFISLCDAFDLPIVFLADTPGFMPGLDSEREAIARHGAKVLYELSRATTPILNVTIRRAYGLGYFAMAGGETVDNELRAVWPSAEIAVMGIDGAVDVAYRREIEAADDPKQKRQEIIDKFTDRTGPVRAAEHFGVDKVLDPRETRKVVSRVLARSSSRNPDGWPSKKHGVTPI
ncbi:acyl-CoA carboxylase subunit beta [Natrinema halophilum]|uniref:acyl-CoA carboxylase subunit beta n=1 Tax=Natrinema halophilum TaxID=1699371 RepID=UPI001F276ED8|nr:carboxyl transferase domain-containing protein [Natrinema halophilum]UHQ96314.1 acyl-CoA carboxylase [Natrinema halophilum]